MWNADRGYGFIADDAGGPDMFLHISALQSAGIGRDNLTADIKLKASIRESQAGKRPVGLKEEVGCPIKTKII